MRVYVVVSLSVHPSICPHASVHLAISLFFSHFLSFTYDCHWKCRKLATSSNEPIIMTLPQESSVIMYRKICNAFKPLFDGFLEDFKNCPYDRERFPQHPAITANLEDHDRSLWDPIDQKKYEQRQNYSWERMHSKCWL